MGRRFKVWLDSDKNSRRASDFEIEVANTGLSEADWDRMLREKILLREKSCRPAFLCAAKCHYKGEDHEQKI
jgi:hypothetical protein